MFLCAIYVPTSYSTFWVFELLIDRYTVKNKKTLQFHRFYTLEILLLLDCNPRV